MTPPAVAAARLAAARAALARAVARGATLVMPSPSPGSRCCSAGANRRGVNPAACSAGQNRFPGRAKWWPVKAE